MKTGTHAMVIPYNGSDVDAEIEWEERKVNQDIRIILKQITINDGMTEIDPPENVRKHIKSDIATKLWKREQ